MWVRARIVGGKTLHWGRMSWRFSDLDFKCASHDGFGADWPISYAEIAPYYAKAEEFIGVSGGARQSAASAERQVHAAYGFNLRRTTFETWLAQDETTGDRCARRDADGHARQAHEGSSQVPLLRQLRRRVRCRRDVQFPGLDAPGRRGYRSHDAAPNSVVRHITVDNNTGKANGVAFVDRVIHAEMEARARIVIVAASTLESTRLLLNSKSRQHPAGLAIHPARSVTI
jgi:choline dehydrogenase-like flavoprotein